MCCSNRRRQQRAPVLVTLGKLAYDKYQERQAVKALENPSFQTSITRSPSPEVIEQNANAEILEKAGINPPSYDDALFDRDLYPHVNVNEKDKRKSDDGEQSLSSEASGSGRGSRGASKWAEKRAERMQRRAEKAAEKAGRAHAKVLAQQRRMSD